MNIVVLCGGLSPERDVSIVSGGQIAKALKENGHSVILLDVFMGYGEEEQDVSDIFAHADEITLSGDGIGQEAPDLDAVRAMRKGSAEGFFGPNVLAICQSADIVFMGLHGEDGENGKVQAAFDLFGIRYTGSSSLSSAVSMNKGYTKRIFFADGVPTPKGFSVLKGDEPQDFSETGMEYPIVIKPASAGSSIGVSIVHGDDEYQEALDKAFAVDDEIVFEEYIKGREFAVGVIRYEALPVIEIAPVNGWYDYQNKYKAGSTIETCPADIPELTERLLQAAAVQAAYSLGLSTYARLDFLVDDWGKVYCLEANTLPGMTPTSLLPQEAQAAGMDFNALCEELIKVSLEKYE